MSPLATAGPPESEAVAPQNKPKIWAVGTLRYDKRQLIVVFFWLMWNDFSFILIEKITGLNAVLMRNHGATFTQMALLGSIGGIITPWINPWVSTWSDRHRGKHGRRRPFLFFATPFFAFFLALSPYMPTFYHYLLRYPFMAALAPHLPMNGPVLFLGVCGLVAGLFNAVFLAIFSYLYWDVVPDEVQGRFRGLSGTVTTLAGLVWSFFIYGIADRHMREVYVGTGIFALGIYLLSVWQIKEGEYPPPDVHKKGGVFAPIRAYFTECFTESYYIWIFAATFFCQLGNKGNDYQFFYLYNDLHMNLATLGWKDGWSSSYMTGFGLLFGFVVGSLTDRLKPVRLMAPLTGLMALINLASFFFIHDKWTCLIQACFMGMTGFALGTAMGAYTIEVFPREKIGQFCSAQAVFYQFGLNFINPFIGMFFDYVKFNRLGYVWAGTFQMIGAAIYVKIYFNWKHRHGQIPVPHAG